MEGAALGTCGTGRSMKGVMLSGLGQTGKPLRMAATLAAARVACSKHDTAARISFIHMIILNALVGNLLQQVLANTLRHLYAPVHPAPWLHSLQPAVHDRSGSTEPLPWLALGPLVRCSSGVHAMPPRPDDEYEASTS